MVRRNGYSPTVIVFILLSVLGMFVVTVPAVPAEDQPIDLNSPDALRHTLEQQVGKRVKIKLVSGQDVDGRIAKVGAHAVVVSDLSGMEFFDATIRVDQVAAVIVKVRTK